MKVKKYFRTHYHQQWLYWSKIASYSPALVYSMNTGLLATIL